MQRRLMHPLILAPLTLIVLVSTLFWAQCWAFMPEISVLLGLFYKGCPAASEEAHYPADIDILVSARYAPDDALETRISLLPGGETIIYQPSKDYDRYRLYNLDTQEDSAYHFPESVDRIAGYLTDEWVVVGHYTKPQQPSTSGWTYALWNRTTEAMVALNRIDSETHLARGIPADLQPLIQAHSTVYLTQGDLILVPTYVGDPSAPATLIQGYRDVPYAQATAMIAANLRDLGVEPINLDTLDSPDRTLRIEPAGYTLMPLATFEEASLSSTVVDVRTRETILRSPLDFFEPIGWAAGQRGVVLGAESRCMSRGRRDACTSRMAHPIVLQRQNAAYLTPRQQAAFAAKDAQEANAKRNAQSIMGILLLASGVLGAATFHTASHALRREIAVVRSARVA